LEIHVSCEKFLALALETTIGRPIRKFLVWGAKYTRAFIKKKEKRREEKRKEKGKMQTNIKNSSPVSYVQQDSPPHERLRH
jgi:glycerol kinase